MRDRMSGESLHCRECIAGGATGADTVPFVDAGARSYERVLNSMAHIERNRLAHDVYVSEPEAAVILQEMQANLLHNLLDAFGAVYYREKCTLRDILIVIEHFGLLDLPKSIETLADEYGITEQRVYQIKGDVLRQLAVICREMGLDAYIDGNTTTAVDIGVLWAGYNPRKI